MKETTEELKTEVKLGFMEMNHRIDQKYDGMRSLMKDMAADQQKQLSQYSSEQQKQLSQYYSEQQKQFSQFYVRSFFGVSITLYILLPFLIRFRSLLSRCFWLAAP